MARYAEWNKFIGNLKTDKYGNTTVNEVGIAFEKATADVVPKSEVEELSGKYEDLKLKYADLHKDKDELIAWGNDEKTQVAREIFEEIEKILIDSAYIPDCARFVNIDKLAELKKKYTENENG
jgi:predicted nuclease with TOPRIM domain